MVFEESRLESKIRYPDPEVTLIRDNKKMPDVCVQDRKCAFGGICSVGKKISQNLILVIKLGEIRTGSKPNITS